MTDISKAGHRQRLRDRFVAGEGNSRTDEALLELLLSYAIAAQYIHAHHGELGLAADWRDTALVPQ